MTKQNSQATIVRAPKDRQNPYKLVRQATFEDKRLTWEARGILAYLLVKPDDWEISVTDLWKSGDVGRDKVYKILAHLEELGYLAREEIRQQGKFVGVRYLLHEEPLPENQVTATMQPCPENQVTVDALPNPENQETATRVTPFPKTPYPVNQEHTNKEENTNYEQQTKDEGEVAADAASPSWSEYLEAFCWICHGHKNLSALTKEQKGALVSEAKRVHDGDFTIDDLRDWFRNFWQNDWRWTKKNGNGKPQHERPRPSDVRSMIPAIRNTEPEQAAPSYSLDVPGIVPLPVNGNGNGHSAPPLPRPMPTDDPWSIAVAELTPVLAATSAARWLQGSRLEPNGELAGVPFYRVVLTADGADAGWMMQQAEPAIRKKVASLLGKRIQLEIVTMHLEPTP